MELAPVEPLRPAAAPRRKLPAALAFLQDVRSHRTLLRYQFLAEVRSSHSSTYLGALWWILEPLFSMSIYVVLLGMILRANRHDYAIFVLCGLLPWHWHARSVSHGAQSLIRASGLIRSLNFPRSIMVLTPMLANGFHALLAMLLVVITMPLFYEMPTWHVVWIVPLMVCQAIFTLSLCLFLSISNVFVRDTEKFIDPLMRAWYFLSPALYDLDRLPKEWQGWMMLNPFATFLPAFRDALMHHRTPQWGAVLIWTAISLVLLQMALWYFERREGRVARVL